MFAAMLMRVAVGGALVACPVCGKRNDVVAGNDGFTCRGCKTRVVVDWV
jgi:tRNA(Ile2) C34 agmatinyltransferase TiaS